VRVTAREPRRDQHAPRSPRSPSVEAEVRLSTELLALTGTVREVRDLLRDDRGARDRVDDHERRIGVIEGRLG
jgi:hypothetical protein